MAEFMTVDRKTAYLLEAKPMAASILYVVAFPLGQEPAEFATPRTGGLKL